MPWPAELRVLDYRCAAVCVFGNGAQSPADMRCEHPRCRERGQPATLAEARALDGWCGPEAALMELRALANLNRKTHHANT